MISVVMGYVNRYAQLNRTLKSMQDSACKDFEVIVVNDRCTKTPLVDNLINEYPDIKIRILQMSDYEYKGYHNPCVVYNVGFSEAQGDKIIIQNPECMHLGDVLSYTEQNLTDENYLSFHCYAGSPQDMKTLDRGEIIKYKNNPVSRGGCWYNHEMHRPKNFHFTTAISRKNLAKLNGFDERFAVGYACDDGEFAFRVKNLLPVKYVASPMVIHQYHAKGNPTGPHNKNLLAKIKKSEPNGIRAYNSGKDIIKEIV